MDPARTLRLRQDLLRRGKILIQEAQENVEQAGLAMAETIAEWHRGLEIPKLSPETRNALKLWEVMGDDLLADGERAADHVARLQGVLARDPYLRWLEMHLDASARTTRHFSPFWGDEPKLFREFRVISFSPTDLLVAHITTRSHNRLPVVLAWLRIVRDFDLSLTPEKIDLIDATLHIHKTALVTETVFARIAAIEEPLAWGMAENSTIAWTNVHILEDLIRAHFGALFPEESWQRVRELADADAPELRSVLGAHMNAHEVPSTANRAGLEEHLENLRKAVGAPTSIDKNLLLEAARSSSCRPDGYIGFLLHAVPAIADSFGYPRLAVLYGQLRSIVELSTRLNGRRFSELTTREIQCLGLSY